jgi:hypothetical protein
MEFRTVARDLKKLDETPAELLACCAWKGEQPMRGLAGLLDWRLSGKLSKLARERYLLGERGEVLFVPVRPRLPFEKLLVFGLGERAQWNEAAFREVVAHMTDALEGLQVRRAVVELPGRAAAGVSAEKALEIVAASAEQPAAHDAWWIVEDAADEKKSAPRGGSEAPRRR